MNKELFDLGSLMKSINEDECKVERKKTFKPGSIDLMDLTKNPNEPFIYCKIPVALYNEILNSKFKDSKFIKGSWVNSIILLNISSHQMKIKNY